MRLAILYAILAAVATAANIGGQELLLQLYGGPYSIFASIFFGTAVGLMVKYLLDKRYIFKFKADNAIHDARVFSLYVIMGLATTFVFWGTEYGFEYYFKSKEMRYVGGVIGLAIGYTLKYQLDRRFVFRGLDRANSGG